MSDHMTCQSLMRYRIILWSCVFCFWEILHLLQCCGPSFGSPRGVNGPDVPANKELLAHFMLAEAKYGNGCFCDADCLLLQVQKHANLISGDASPS